MKRSTQAWLLLPAVIVVLAVVGLIVSRYQDETGLIEPGKSGLPAVAAVLTWHQPSSGTTQEDYEAFSQTLLAALTACRNAAFVNVADTRLENLLAGALDCLSALNEAWLAELEQTWDMAIHRSSLYWRILHPALDPLEDEPLGPARLRDLARERAGRFLKKALDIVT